MIFFDCATAPSPRRARMFLAEKGLAPETREVSLIKGEQMTPDFLSVNPRATVPVLVTEGGATLTENLAIAVYLNRIQPDPPLIGTTAEEEAEILMWNAISEAQGGSAVAEALRNGNPHMKGRAITGPQNYEQIPELAQRGMARWAAFKDLMNDHLADREFVAAEQFSLADITTFVFCDFARVIKDPVTDEHANLKSWFDRIVARPSASL